MLASKVRSRAARIGRAASLRGWVAMPPPIPLAALGAGPCNIHMAGAGGTTPGWTAPPSASWWATRKRPSSSLGSLNYPHVAPDPLADPSIFDEINAFSLKRQTGVSLKTLLDTGACVHCWGEMGPICQLVCQVLIVV